MGDLSTNLKFINAEDNMPLVSVIMPAYNSEKFIGRAIGSVINQSFFDWELIVVDDKSVDNTISTIGAYCDSDIRIKQVQLKYNSGAAVARNVGIQHAHGRYIAFLDSDDRWLPHKLESQIDFISKNKASLAFSAYKRVNELGDEINIVTVPKTVSYHQLLKSCVIGCLTAIYDTKKFGKTEMPLIKKRQDFGLWLKLLRDIDCAYGQNKVLAEYTVRASSISSNKKSAAAFQWKVYRELENLSLFKASYYFAHYAANGLIKKQLSEHAKRFLC